jgi:hypothetical protein
MADLGNGAYIKWDGTEVSRVVSISGLSRSVAVVDAETLKGNAAIPLRPKCISDRVEHDSFDVTLYGDFSSGTGVANWMPEVGQTYVIHVYSPVDSKYWTADAALVGTNSGDFNVDEKHEQTLTFQLTGATKITVQPTA